MRVVFATLRSDRDGRTVASRGSVILLHVCLATVLALKVGERVGGRALGRG